jgi:glycosyltransferase involved in cell wall biosynthesis
MGPVKDEDPQLVSIIIPTQNSSQTLDICLRSIELQDYAHIRTIVVDAYSRDATQEIARNHNVTVLQSVSSRSAARNIGTSQSGGEYLLFIDSDMELSPELVSECVETTRKLRVDAVMIPEVRVGIGFWAKCRALERMTYIGDPLIESARFFQRKTIISLGGFDERLEAGEDWDLQARLENAHRKLGRVRSVVKHHEGRLTLRRLISKQYYYGKTIMKYVRKNPAQAKIQFLPIRLNYLRSWRLLAANPRYCAGMIFMRFVESVAVLISISTTVGSNDSKAESSNRSGNVINGH